MKTINEDIKVTYRITQRMEVSEDVYHQLKDAYEFNDGIVDPGNTFQTETINFLNENINPLDRYSTEYELLDMQEEKHD